MIRSPRPATFRNATEKIFIAAVLAAIGLALVSCGKEGPSSSKAPGTSPNAAVAKGPGAGWIRGVPQYPGASTLGKAGKPNETQTVTFTTPDPAAKVLEYYRTQLTAQGWNVVTDADAGPGHTLAFEGPGKSKDVISITATPKGGQSWVDASFSPAM